MASLFDIGKSGLNSYRQALAVTGQNIANINTDGYKRRGVDLEEVSANQSGINSVGNSPGLGVRVAEIRRAFDEFLLNKARSATAYAEATSTFSNSIKQLEDIVLPGDANLGAAIGRFFTGLQEIASTPSDLAARTVALEQAKQMAESFNETSALINGYSDGLLTRVDQELADVNVLTEELAAINRRLSTTGGATQNNSLLDSRDAIIDKLSEYVEVTVDLNNKGVARVTLGDHGNGPRLVEADKATKLGSTTATGKLGFVLAPGAEDILTSQVTNGSLAGVAAAYSTAGDVMAEIDNLAFVLVREFNAIHNRGLNLEGERSGDLFRAIDVRITPNPVNTGSASTELTVTDYNLVGSERVTFTYDSDAAIWNGRNDFGKIVASGRGQITLPGIAINFLGQPAAFDQFIYDPVTSSAAGVSVVIKRPQDFAAASPLLVSADPRNASKALIEAVPTDLPSPPGLPSMTDVFSNNRSAVAATGFLSGGAVAVIPANAASVDIFSLSGQSTARFAASPESLGDADEITVTIRSLDANGLQVERIVDFNVAFDDVKGFEGRWLNFGQVADLMNLGTITGTVRGSGETVNLVGLGGYASGAGGNLTLALTENDFQAASMVMAGGQTIDGAVTAATEQASDVQIFTREGRHIAGTLQGEAGRQALQAMMTEANGFNDGAVYVGDYLNASGEDGYLGTVANASSGTEVLVTSRVEADETVVTFTALEGIDTNESSVDGMTASAATVGYSMSVGDVSATVGAAEISGTGGDDVAAAMLRALRGSAPVALLIGAPAAAPLDDDSVRIRFEGQTYTVTMTDGEPLVSGGEEGRLDAFFDAEKSLNIVSTAGTITRSAIDVVAGVGDEANVAAARRFGLMDEVQQASTRYSGEFVSIEGAADTALDKVVMLNFDRDDSYNLGFIFGGKPDFGASALTDMAFTLSNMSVTGGDASAVAAAINGAVADNATDGDGGADLSSLVSATAIGSLVKVTIKNGLEVEIQSPNGAVSNGDGEVGIETFTQAPLTGRADAALQLEEDRIYRFAVNGQTMEVDTTVHGLRVATGGTLAGAIADAAAAITAAIDARSGPGTGSVSTALSVTGSTIMFDMTDASGAPIVISDFQNLSRAASLAGEMTIDLDVPYSTAMTVSDGEYLTDDKLSTGAPLEILTNDVATLAFSDESLVYQFGLDIDGDGTIGASESFMLDGVTKDFQEEMTRVASEITSLGGGNITSRVHNGKIEILNDHDDRNVVFDAGTALSAPAVDAVTAGTAHFRPQAASDSTLQDETDSVQMLDGDTAISESGLLSSAPDATAALQFEEGKIFTFAVNGRQIEIDTTDAGIRAATGGTLSGAISDAVAAVREAVEATSGLGTATVSSASSLTGSTIRLDITDDMGNPVVISDFEQVTRPAHAAGSLTILQDITTTTAVQRDHGAYLTSDGQSGSGALAIADGATGSIAFSSQTQRYEFTLDADGDGAIAGSETYVIDGVKGDFQAQLSAVASQISAVTGITATVVNGTLQLTNSRGDGTSLAFGTASALASDPLNEVTVGAAFFKAELPAGAALDLDSTAVSLTTGSTAHSSDGILAASVSAFRLTDSYTPPNFDLRREGDRIIVSPDAGTDMPDITTSASSLAKQRYTLSNLPGEDLIMLGGDTGARRLSVQYDMLPEVAVQPHRDIEIRVTDAAAGEVTYFDVETGTSLANRRLDDEQAATALSFEVAFTGALADEDSFLISGNRDGIGDNRNMERLLRLQAMDVMGAGSGGFQKVFSATVAKLGAVVQSSDIATEAAFALRDASLEAESEFTGVNLDTEAANLIEQQQAYQASARILATARELFDTLIQSV